ncbi:RICIN domain-containing protein [Streptosporangium sp. NBC_01756]|uniref:RICIN domain-containing protein n=1 Tax=Streptosporangium sp. NBC_01756 TaxID=2975950 RepID=UPI002DDB4686|nr:RICIN domain-containing protein [Streptosporangium sp. NBC_01756]WSC86392.1 RICIN domain-containing protein [Streptosporangium sp. NBC_01756]
MEVGYSYRLKNKRSGLYLTSCDFSPDSFATQWKAETAGNARLSQIWHLLGLDNEDYLIFQKLGGNLLTPNDYSSSNTRVNLFPLQNTEDQRVRNSQIWKITPAGNGYYTITNKNGGLLLTPNNFNTNEDRINTWYPEDGQYADSQLWALEQADTYPLIANAKIGATGNQPGTIFRLTGYAPTAQDITSEVLIGQTILPAPLISDPSLDKTRQAQTSPYYLLKRYGFYKRVFYYEHSGTRRDLKSTEVVVGMTTTNSLEVENTTTISMTRESGMEVDGFTSSMSVTISNELRVMVSKTTVEEHRRTDKVEREYLADGKRIAEAVWYRCDRYVLHRTDGSKVLEWETMTDQNSIDDAYPHVMVPTNSLTSSTSTLAKGTDFTLEYSTPPDTVSAKNWIGLYPAGAKPGDQDAIVWKYASGASGLITLSTGAVPGPGTYTAWYCHNDGYTVLQGPVTVTVG